MEKISYLKLGLATTEDDEGALPESDNEVMDQKHESSRGDEDSESVEGKPTKMKINDFLV